MPEAEKITTLQQAAAALEKLMAGVSKIVPSGAGVGGGGGVMSGPTVGSVPGVVSAPQMRGAPVNIPQFNPTTTSRQYVPPATFETGTEFRTKGGRNAAIVSGLIGNVTSTLKAHRDKSDSEKRAKTDNMMRFINEQLAAGNHEFVTSLLMNPQNASAFTRAFKEQTNLDWPTEPAPKSTTQPPFHVGGEGSPPSASMSAPQPPPVMMMPTPSNRSQIQSLVDKAMLQTLQSGGEVPDAVKAAAAMGYGPQVMLSGQEQKQAARIAAGLGVPASVVAQLDAERQNVLSDINTRLEISMNQTANSYKMLQEQLASEEKRASAGNAAQLAASRIAADAHLGVLKGGMNARETLQGQLMEFKEKQDAAAFDRAAILAHRNLVNTYTTAAVQMQKAGNEEEAANYKKLAAESQAAAEDVEKRQNRAGADVWKRIEKILNAQRNEK